MKDIFYCLGVEDKLYVKLLIIVNEVFLGDCSKIMIKVVWVDLLEKKRIILFINYFYVILKFLFYINGFCRM